jgi:hypothetical protein
MPKLSLIVCLYGQRDLLERLIRNSQGCYDDLLVVHDGPDEQNVKAIVEAAGGRFFERPRAFQREPHFPFAFGEAKNDWILHFDADEFPSIELKKWLEDFRRAPAPPAEISGYTCIFPLWNGKKAISKKIEEGRAILFNRERVKFFGMAETGVVPDGRFERTGLAVCHQPNRKTYGLHNVLIRKQAYRWREVIAKSLLGKPTDLACWRWTDENWPLGWEQIRQRPLQIAARRLVMMTFRGLKAQWREERRFYFEAALNGSIHHALLCLKFWQLRRQTRKRHGPVANQRAR